MPLICLAPAHSVASETSQLTHTETDRPPVSGQFPPSFWLVSAQFPLWPKFSLLLFLLVCGRIRLKVSNDGIYR